LFNVNANSFGKAGSGSAVTVLDGSAANTCATHTTGASKATVRRIGFIVSPRIKDALSAGTRHRRQFDIKIKL
jgi:hypothetical protein